MARFPMQMGGGGSFRWPVLLLFLVGAAFYWFSNQKSAPLTGRNQFITSNVGQESALGLEAYRQILSQSNVVREGEAAQTVRAIGERIARAAVNHPDPAISEIARGFEWQFELIESDQANAFCLPGGKVAVYTGLLPIAKNSDGLAAIMGHEVAHALARHGGERMSQQQLMQFGQMAVAMAAGDLPPQAQQAVMGAFGAGAQFGVLLPFSRKHEEEADQIGLDLLVRACFDPTEAPALWERMKELSGGQASPEFASTHPAPETRAQNFREWMEGALKLRRDSCAIGSK